MHSTAALVEDERCLSNSMYLLLNPIHRGIVYKLKGKK
jgi:hypothetical protein